MGAVKDNNVVVIDNKMVKAKFGKLSDIESRFIFFAISQIKYTDTEFPTFRFSVGTLLKELDVPGKNYTFLFGVLKNMVERTIAFPGADPESFTIFPWFSMLRVEKKEMIGIRFNDMLKPYLLELRKNFTKAELSLILQMKNHTRRIYLTCKQYLNMGGFEKSINALRTELELGDFYKQYKYLARDILIPARDEINKLSDIRFSFEPVRVGRSYTLLRIKVWAAPIINKAIVKNAAGDAGKNTAAKNKQIEDKRRESKAEYQKRTAQEEQKEMEALMLKWSEQCKELEPYLTRKSDLWGRCLKNIEGALVGAASFETWFVCTELFFDDSRTAHILVPNNFAVDVLQCNYTDLVTDILTKNKVDFAAVKFVSPDIKRQYVTTADAPAVESPAVELFTVESLGENEENAADAVENYSNGLDLFAGVEQTALF